jgi:hypothetical protein
MLNMQHAVPSLAEGVCRAVYTALHGEKKDVYDDEYDLSAVRL